MIQTSYYQHRRQRERCMNRDCRKKCNIKRVPVFLECGHYFCRPCYHDKTIDKTCRLCSPDIVHQPKSKVLVDTKDLEPMEKVKEYVESLSSSERHSNSVRLEDDLDFWAERVDENEIIDKHVQTSATSEKSEEEQNEERRRKIESISSVVRELANLNLNCSTDFALYTNLPAGKLKVIDVRKFLGKCDNATFHQRYEKVEELVKRLTKNKKKGEEGVQRFTQDFKNSYDKFFETHVWKEHNNIVEENPTRADARRWKLDTYFEAKSDIPEDIDNLEEQPEHVAQEKLVATITRAPAKIIRKQESFGKRVQKSAEFEKKQVCVLSDTKSAPFYNPIVTISSEEQECPTIWRDELYTENNPQPQIEFEKQQREVVIFLSRKFRKDSAKNGKLKSLENIGEIINKLTIYENCRDAVIKMFENKYDVKVPIII